MRTLAEQWGCDPSYATAIIDRLEALGLAERQAAPADRRVKMVMLTSKGLRTRTQVLEEFHEPPPEVGGLDREDLEALERILARWRRPHRRAVAVVSGRRADAGPRRDPRPQGKARARHDDAFELDAASGQPAVQVQRRGGAAVDVGNREPDGTVEHLRAAGVEALAVAADDLEPHPITDGRGEDHVLDDRGAALQMPACDEPGDPRTLAQPRRDIRKLQLVVEEHVHSARSPTTVRARGPSAMP